MNNVLLKEKLPHGDVMFPLEVHLFDTDVRLNERVNWHWHDELELLVVTKGRADFHINERSYRVSEEEILFVNSNLLHSATSVENMPCSFFAVVFSSALLGGYSNDIIWQKYIAPVLKAEISFPEYIKLTDRYGEQILALLYEIQKLYYEKGSAYELLIKTKLCEIWSLLLSVSENTKSIDTNNNNYRIARIKAILEYITERYSQKISLPELAAAFGMSEGQFCRFFKSMVKHSVVEYINSYRINESAVLLQKSDKDIGEIACMVGFNNISYFNKIFRRLMHCSPTEFRNAGKGLV